MFGIDLKEEIQKALPESIEFNFGVTLKPRVVVLPNGKWKIVVDVVKTS